MESILIEREAELLKAIDQLRQQEEWASNNRLMDLVDAYAEGRQHLRARLVEVQNLIRALG